MNAPGPTRRGPFSLLTGRWHASSRVAAALTFLLLVVCNLPGQLVEQPQTADMAGLMFSLGWIDEQHLQHGWPMTYLVREAIDNSVIGPSPAWLWKIHAGVEEFHVGSLLVNLAIVLLIGYFAGMGFEAWRRQRQYVWQVHLRDLVGLITVVCLAGAWYAARRHSQAREESAAERHDELQVVHRNLGGITWLRLLLGDTPFGFLDRARMVSVKTCTQDELSRLEVFDELEVLEIESLYVDDGKARFPGTDHDPAHDVQLPRLPRLKALIVLKSETRLAGLGRLLELESVMLRGAHVDEPMMRELAKLPRLKTLTLDYGLVEKGALDHLASFVHLESLYLRQVPMSEKNMEQLGELSQLKSLGLSPAQVPRDSLRHLCRLTELESLNVSGAPVGDDVLAPLARLRKLEILDLSSTLVTPRAIPELARMKQLCHLNVAYTGLSDQDIARLAELLPQCKVYGSRTMGFRMGPVRPAAVPKRSGGK